MTIGGCTFHLSICSKIRSKIRSKISSCLPSLCLLSVVILTGCAIPPSLIPVANRTQSVASAKGVHVVKSGETLYAIARKYRKNFKKLASNNKISSPYVIYPGQRLRLEGGVVVSKKVTKSLKNKTVVSTSHPVKTGVKSAPNRKRTKVNKGNQKQIAGNVSWQWPTDGKLIAQFSPGGRSYKGIAIGGQIGEPVVATAGGEVVYSGAGLTGYGNLVIIKHNSRYLSAYAHNRTLLVGEGEVVKAGQQIAELGSTGTNEPKLHFEIRQNGEPVDPLLFLPNR